MEQKGSDNVRTFATKLDRGEDLLREATPLRRRTARGLPAMAAVTALIFGSTFGPTQAHASAWGPTPAVTPAPAPAPAPMPQPSPPPRATPAPAPAPGPAVAPAPGPAPGPAPAPAPGPAPAPAPGPVVGPAPAPGPAPGPGPAPAPGEEPPLSVEPPVEPAPPPEPPPEPAPPPEPVVGPAPAPAPDPLPAAADPVRGQKLRRAGIGTMIAGGVVAAVGFGVTLAFTIQGRKRHDELAGVQDDNQRMDCSRMPKPNAACSAIATRITDLEDQISGANRTAQISGALMVTGFAVLAIGGIVYRVGMRKLQPPSLGNLRLSPSLGGVVLSGRF